jgi:flagellar motor switch protein FliN/FliY
MPQFTQEDLNSFSNAFDPIGGQLAVVLAECVGETVTSGTPSYSIESQDTITGNKDRFIQCPFAFPDLSANQSVVAFSEADALAISGILAADEPKAEAPDVDARELSETQIEQLSSVLNGAVMGLGLALAESLGKQIEPENGEPIFARLTLPPSFALSGQVVQVTLPVTIKGTFESAVCLYLSAELAQAIAELAPAIMPEEAPAAGDQPLDPFSSIFEAPVDAPGFPSGASPFKAFEPFAPANNAMPGGIGLIMDIPLDVTIELGRVRMLIKDVLDLSAGSIVELERVAGEPVDLMVNGRLVAKGEVVVIEDNFGLRITEIISPSDRLNGAGKRP